MKMLTVYVSHFQVPVNNSSIVQEIIKAPSETGLVCDPVQEQQQRQRKEDVSFSSSDNANANTNIYYSQEEDSATTTHVSSEPSSKSNYTFTSKRKQSCIDSFIPKKMSLSQKERVDNLLVNLIIKDYQPFSIVEDEGFKEFVKGILPNYQMPSRKYLSNNLINLKYEKCHAAVLSKLFSIKSICITTDHWTSLKNESYIGVTGHYIDDNFKMCHVLLECIKFCGQHTASAIASELSRILTAWDINNKVLIIVTDNAANITKAVKGEMCKEHYGCFAHKLNLCVKAALNFKDQEEDEDEDDTAEVINDNDDDSGQSDGCMKTISKIKNIVNHMKRSTQANEKLSHAQVMLGRQQPLNLVNSVATRWNCTFLMLEQFVYLQEALRITFANWSALNIQQLTEREWFIAEELCNLLRPLHEATQEMSGEEYLTASKIIPVSFGLIKVTQIFVNEKAKHCTVVAKKLVKELKERFFNLEHSLTIATCSFLDPRFKQHVFEDNVALKTVQKTVTELTAAQIRNRMRMNEQKKTDISQKVATTILNQLPIGQHLTEK